MIFWWSESRLAQFIEDCAKQGYIQQEIDTLSGKIEGLEKTREEDREAIQQETDTLSGKIEGLGKTMKEDREVISQNYTANLTRLGHRMDVIEKSQLAQAKEPDLDGTQGLIQSLIDGMIEEIKSDYIQYVKKAISENNETQIERVQQKIRSELAQYMNGIITQNNLQINKALMNHESELKRLSAEMKAQSSTDFLAAVKSYEDEKKKTAELSEKVRKQADAISMLSGMIEELKGQIEMLKAKLSSNRADIPAPPPRKALFFDDDKNENKGKLLTLLDQAKLLKDKLCKAEVDSDVYLKLAENLIDKLDKLIAKNKEKKYTADKLANEIVKILKQTIIKGMTQEKVKEVFKEYMDGCAIRRLEWSIGRKVSHDDYEYLEEPIIYENVNDDNKAGTILEIIQDTYVIDYVEDDERYEAIIPGLYRIGKTIKKNE